MPSAAEVQSPNPWTASEFPGASLVLSLGSVDLGLNSVLPPFYSFISVGVLLLYNVGFVSAL